MDFLHQTIQPSNSTAIILTYKSYTILLKSDESVLKWICFLSVWQRRDWNSEKFPVFWNNVYVVICSACTWYVYVRLSCIVCWVSRSYLVWIPMLRSRIYCLHVSSCCLCQCSAYCLADILQTLIDRTKHLWQRLVNWKSVYICQSYCHFMKFIC